MPEETKKGRGLKALVLLAVLGGLIVVGQRAWTAAASPGEAEVMAAFARIANFPEGEEREDSFDLIVYWAAEMPGSELRVGEWVFRTGSEYLRSDGLRRGLESEERYLLAFPDRQDQDGTGEAGEYYFLAARPVTFFARMRLFWHELGEAMGDLDKPNWNRYASWRPPDRDPPPPAESVEEE